MRSGVVFSLPLLLALLSGHVFAASDASIDVEATLGFDDNVTRAEQNIDIEHAGFMTVAGTGGYILHHGDTGLLTAKAILEMTNVSRFKGLSHVVAGGKLNYTFGFWQGFRAPWFSAEVGYDVVEFNSFLRDSDIFRASFLMGVNLDDATSILTGFNYNDRESEGKAFDTTDSSFFINLDWKFAKRKTIYLTYKYQTGDTFSIASRVSLPVISASAPNIEDDDVFVGKKAYKLDATIQFVTLGYNIARNLNASFDFSARYLEADATDVDLVYSGLVLKATYFHRFSL